MSVCVCMRFSIFVCTVYILQIQSVRSVWLSCNKLYVRFCPSVYQQSEEERLNWLLCMANLLSSLIIEVKADLCDCQYTSSSGLCYASESVKWKQIHWHRKSSNTPSFCVLGNANACMSNTLEADVYDYLEAVTQTYTQKSSQPF